MRYIVDAAISGAACGAVLGLGYMGAAFFALLNGALALQSTRTRYRPIRPA